MFYYQARERRDGQGRDEPDALSTTADYRAVAPDAKSYVIFVAWYQACVFFVQFKCSAYFFIK